MWWTKKSKSKTLKYGPNPFKKRNFEAVEARLLSGWETNSSSIDHYIRNNIVTLSSRSREQVRNNEYARRFISLSKSNIIGSKGVTYQSQIVDSRGELDTIANTTMETAFKDWALKHCCINEANTWIDFQNLALVSMAIDGDCIIELFQGSSFGKYGLQLRLIDPMLLDADMNYRSRNGNLIKMGIERDDFDRVVAYHFRTVDESGYYQSGNHRRVAAENIIHAFRPEWVGQSRGIPWMAAALYRMKMLHGYDEAAIAAARAGASKMGFYKPDVDADSAEFGTTVDDAGEPIDEATPGHMEKLPNGWDFQSYDPNYPHEQYPHFVKSTLRGMSSGLDISYPTFANDLEGVNYSSIRTGVLEDRELWKSLQEMIIQRVVEKVVNKWIRNAYLSFNVKIGNQPINRGVDYYNKFILQGKRWSWVDPLKDINAADKAHMLSTRSISSIIRESGLDPDEVFREIAADKQKLIKLGIKDEIQEPEIQS